MRVDQRSICADDAQMKLGSGQAKEQDVACLAVPQGLGEMHGFRAIEVPVDDQVAQRVTFRAGRLDADRM